MSTVAAAPAPRRYDDAPRAALLAGALPLFVGALLADLAYARTFEVQWINFAAWLNAGALLLAGIALLLALVAAFRGRRGGRDLATLAVLAAAFAVGFFGALVHARDAWATMPAATWLSLAAAVLAAIATGLAFAVPRGGVEP